MPAREIRLHFPCPTEVIQKQEAKMLAIKRSRQAGKFTTLAVAAAAVIGLIIPMAPASAQIYLGLDFGNGFGIGVGQVPSAQSPCPTYGWPWSQHCEFPR